MASKKSRPAKRGSRAKGDKPERGSKAGQPARGAAAPEDPAATLAKWKEHFRWFVDACESKAGALLRARGFVGPEVEVALGDTPQNPPACRVCYKADAAQLCFETNYYGEVVAFVTAGSPPRAVGLGWYMEELAPGEAPSMEPRQGALRPEESLVLLDRYATFLHEHIDEVLSGDPALMGRISARIQAALAG